MPGRGRGRGRGRGSRGGGRGRGGRGRSGGRGRGDWQDEPKDAAAAEVPFADNPIAFFTGTASAKQHLDAQNEHRSRYCAALSVLAKTGIQISQNARVRALAIAYGRGDIEMASTFLKLRSLYGLAEVHKAVTLLDAGRQVRVLEKRYKSWELSLKKVMNHKMGKLKRDIDNMNKMKLPIGSASGAVCKHVAKWVRGFTAEEFDFYAAHFPKDPWKKLADICHFNPKKDFAAAPWFLPFCFGTGEPPQDSLASMVQRINQENVNEMISGMKIPYSILKEHKDALTPESKKIIAQYEQKLDTVLWYYEDLRCDEVDEVLNQRLTDGEPVTLSNGKLLERLLTILLLRKPQLYDAPEGFEDSPDTVNFFTRLVELAEPRLTSIRLPLESPIVVIGDASPSMMVAIRTSTIIASLLTSICSAELVFFDSVNRKAPFLPETVKQMLQLAVTIKTTGSTAPAASLWPFYNEKKIVKTFIIVTDEEENSCFENHRFCPLFMKYYKEVYPAKLVFVSFLHHQHAKGQMITELRSLNFNPQQLRLDGNRPDLSKLDDLFGQLSAFTASFDEELEAAESEVKKNGMVKLFEGLQLS